ncbi:hypothetical protein PVNG_06370 [Plasmodium vivax North Korean]|uniref:VIR protein n=1 Tax=Plasmodium vivax North Korean TaxID=1035514 RepID=A0A0J9WEG2_PLAVI|nr:hypothetical protein PVNG_06370 [Plasmodium vivax North Korean]
MQYRENDERYTCGRCKLLNYWLYHEVKKNLSPEYQNKYAEIITQLHAAWSKYKIHKVQYSGRFQIVVVDPQCKPETLIPPIQDIEDQKNIHEHCLNYYEISKNSSINECQEYKTYMQHKTSLYDKFKDSFSEIDEEKCSTYYNKCYSYDPKNFLSANNCPHNFTMPSVPVEKGAQERTPTIYTEEVEGPPNHQEEHQRLSSNMGAELVSAKGEKADSAKKGDGLHESSKEVAKPSIEEGKAPIHKQEEHSKGRGIQAHMSGDGILQNSRRYSEGFAIPGGEDYHAEGDLATFPSSANNPSNVMPFTPLRSVFYKLIHKNKSPINHHHEVPEELLEYMVTSGSNNRDNRPNYIAYHPA